ncbi:MAG: hypothetical protein C0500_05660 [Sphingobium sp.]|nr:hypothetical protein [Sphingobium sp.]
MINFFPVARWLLPIAAVGLLASLAWAQNSAFDEVQRIEAQFARVETYRLEGDCPSRDRALRDLTNFLAPYLRPDAVGFRPAVREEYRTRLDEARARPCPPPAPAPALKPLPQTTTLEDLDFAFMLACGCDFEPARERLLAAIARAERMATTAAQRAELAENRRLTLAQRYRPCSRQPNALDAAQTDIRKIADELSNACGDQWSVVRLRMLAALDRAIAADRSPDRLQDYQQARAGLLRRDPPPCAPPTPTTTVAGGAPNFDAMRRYTEAAMFLDQGLDRAERDLQSGYCDGFRREMVFVRATYDRMIASGYTPPSPPPVLARYEAMKIKPCPPPRVEQVTDVKPTVANPGVPRPAPTPRPKAVRVCASSFDTQAATGRMTCRCAGMARFLMTWGSDPYRGNSNICNAAVHAGVLPANGVGAVTIRRVSGAKAALGTSRNGVSTSNWDFAFDKAFTVEAAPSP